jgi:O-antigen/teichoic acid export membrane protein
MKPAAFNQVARMFRSVVGSPFCRDILETYGARVFVVGVTFVATVVIARELGPAGRGLYAVAVAIGAIGAQFGNFGLHASNTYYVAKDRTLLPVLTGNMVVVLCVVCAITVLCGVGFAYWPRLAPLRGGLLMLALVSVPIGLAYLLSQGLLLGVNEVRAYNRIECGAKFLALLLICAAALAHSKAVTLFFSITLLALLLSFIWAFARLRQVSNEPPALSWAMFRQSLGIGVKAYLIAFFGFLLLRIDLVMVKYMEGATQAGFYSISQVLTENTMMFPVVLGLILFPKLSSISDKSEKSRLTNKAVLVTAALMLPVAMIGVWAAKPIITVAFGRAFLPAVAPFVWLMPGTYFLGLETVMVQFLNSEGFPPAIVVAWIAATLLNIAINFWAIPRYGITGASAVSSVCYFLMFLIVSGLVWKRTAGASVRGSAIDAVPLIT